MTHYIIRSAMAESRADVVMLDAALGLPKGDTKTCAVPYANNDNTLFAIDVEQAEGRIDVYSYTTPDQRAHMVDVLPESFITE